MLVIVGVRTERSTFCKKSDRNRIRVKLLVRRNWEVLEGTMSVHYSGDEVEVLLWDRTSKFGYFARKEVCEAVSKRNVWRRGR